MARKMNFFEDFYESGLELTERERERLYTAMLDYYFAGKEPQLSGGAAAVFRVVRERIDLSKTRSSAGAEGGSSPKQTRSKTQANTKQDAKQDAKQNESKREAKSGFAPGVREGEREREEEHSKGECSSAPALPDAYPDGSAPPRGAVRYQRPEPAQVEAFVAASGCGCAIDGAAFCGWYDDHGWPPVGWQNTALRWAREDRDRRAKGGRRARPETGEVRADERAVAEELAQFRAV